MDMPDLPEDQTPQEDSEISIELQFPVGIAEVTSTSSIPPSLSLPPFLSLPLSSLSLFSLFLSLLLF